MVFRLFGDLSLSIPRGVLSFAASIESMSQQPQEHEGEPTDWASVLMDARVSASSMHFLLSKLAPSLGLDRLHRDKLDPFVYGTNGRLHMTGDWQVQEAGCDMTFGIVGNRCGRDDCGRLDHFGFRGLGFCEHTRPRRPGTGWAVRPRYASSVPLNDFVYHVSRLDMSECL